MIGSFGMMGFEFSASCFGVSEVLGFGISQDLAHLLVCCISVTRRVVAAMFLQESLGHFQVGSYRYRSLIEGLYTL